MNSGTYTRQVCATRNCYEVHVCQSEVSATVQTWNIFAQKFHLYQGVSLTRFRRNLTTLPYAKLSTKEFIVNASFIMLIQPSSANINTSPEAQVIVIYSWVSHGFVILASVRQTQLNNATIHCWWTPLELSKVTYHS